MRFRVWKSFREKCSRLNERYGFALLVTICIGIITGTALWTKREPAVFSPSVTPFSSESLSASLRMQQSLLDAATPTPLPSPSAAPSVQWHAPLSSCTILREFSLDSMSQSAETGLWGFHDGIDLGAEMGASVVSAGNGSVINTGEDMLHGCWVTAAYDGDIRITYAGMAMLAAIQTGDKLHAGQTIGFSGKGLLDEQNLGPHLHLSVEQGGKRINPRSILPLDE